MSDSELSLFVEGEEKRAELADLQAPRAAGDTEVVLTVLRQVEEIPSLEFVPLGLLGIEVEVGGFEDFVSLAESRLVVCLV